MTEKSTHMRAEIDETSDALARQLSANAPRIEKIGERLKALAPPLVVTIARGSSDHCALYLKYLVEIELGVPCASIGPSIASLYHARSALAAQSRFPSLSRAAVPTSSKCNAPRSAAAR